MIKRVTLKDWSYADMQDFKQMEIHPDGSVFFFTLDKYGDKKETKLMTFNPIEVKQMAQALKEIV